MANAIVDPWTVVVKTFDTLVAVVTVPCVIDLNLALGAQLGRVDFGVLDQPEESIR